jgi:hypothetical protein
MCKNLIFRINNIFYMDVNTTNINELPIDQNPPDNRELPLDIPNSNNRNMLLQEDEPSKKVHFNNVEEVEDIPKNTLYNVSDINKVIILASIIFLLFSDIKVRNFIMTFLVNIFGSSLKLQSGGISKLGLVAYSIIYGLALFILVNGIEIIIDKYS